jgi:hypothetical protein
MSLKKLLKHAATQMTDLSPITVGGVRNVRAQDHSAREIALEAEHVRRATQTQVTTRRKTRKRSAKKPTAITLSMLKYDPDLTSALARREGGIDVISDGHVAFRLWIPHKPLKESWR